MLPDALDFRPELDTKLIQDYLPHMLNQFPRVNGRPASRVHHPVRMFRRELHRTVSISCKPGLFDQATGEISRRIGKERPRAGTRWLRPFPEISVLVGQTNKVRRITLR